MTAGAARAEEPARVPVTFTWRDVPGLRVELLGDLPLWDRPLLVPEVAPGEYRLRLELGPGVYRYKFLVDWRRWVRDPDAPVDWTEGTDNSVVVVAGTQPPVFFSSDRRHARRDADGTLHVHLEVEEGARAPSALWVRAGDALRSAPLVPQGRWRGRVLLAASLAVPPRALGHFGFEGLPAPVFALPPPVPASAAMPAWAKDTVWYGIFLDRWHRGGASADPRVTSRDEPTGAGTFYGGDLEGVRQALPALAALGVTGVALTPVHPSPTPHRYDTTDHHAVDERLGGKAALTALVEDAHRHGLRVAADVSFTHVHEDHPFWREVLKRQARARHAKWFQVKRFPVKRGDPTRYGCYAQRPELPLLDLSWPAARAHVIDAAVSLVKLGVDALRLDAMTDAPPVLWRELREAVRAVRRDVALLGEVVMDAQPHYAADLGADCLTDFQHREALLEVLRGSMRPDHFVAWTRFLEFRQGPLSPSSRLRFLDNHDTSRVGSLLPPAQVRLALAYLLLRPEPAWLTYGTELDLAAGVPLFRLDDAWPERLPMPALDGPAPLTRGLVRALLALRKTLDAAPVTLEQHGPLLAFERARRGGGAARVTFNLSNGVARLPPEATGPALLTVNEPLAAARRDVLPPWAARVTRRA